MSIFNGAAADIENNKNKVDEITETSTNEQYPGAKATYDLVKQQVNGAIKPIELTGTELDVTASPQLENGFYKAAQNMKLVRAQGETENYYIPKDAVFAVYKSYDSEIGGDYTYYEVQLLNGCLLGEVGETISPFSTGNSYFYARVSLMGNIEYTVVSKMATDEDLQKVKSALDSKLEVKVLDYTSTNLITREQLVALEPGIYDIKYNKDYMVDPCFGYGINAQINKSFDPKTQTFTTATIGFTGKDGVARIKVDYVWAEGYIVQNKRITAEGIIGENPGDTIGTFVDLFMYPSMGLVDKVNGYALTSDLNAEIQKTKSQIGLKTAALPEQSSAPSAGSKAYLITACDQTAKTFTLDGVYGLAVGDVYSISAVGYANVEDVGKITAINGKVVTVDHLPVENGVGYGNAVPSSDALPENFPQGLAAPYFRIIAKPTVGSQTIGTAALAGGISTEAQMDTSFATGKGSKSVGKYGVAMGNKNMAYYAAIAGGGGSNKAFGKNSGIIAGSGNKTNSYAAFVGGGIRNEIDGACAFGTGSFNKVPGFNAAAFGLYNEAHGQNDFVTGYKNIINGDCAAAFGLLHNIKGKGNFATGQANTAKEGAENCLISGQSNSAENAAGCILAGQNNTVNGESAEKKILQGVMLGAGNKATGHYGVAAGYNNIAGTQSLAVGANNKADGWLRFAIGQGLTVSNDRQVVVGTYNKSQAAAFIVGNGTSDTARSNAFVVNKDGSAEVGKQGTKDNSVVTLETLITKINAIKEFAQSVSSATDLTAVKTAAATLLTAL